MQDRPVTSPSWHEYENTGTVADDAERITFGALVDGVGTFAYDDFRLAVAGEDGRWTPVEVADPGFERGDAALHRDDAGTPVRPAAPGWGALSPGFVYQVTEGDAAKGQRALAIRRETRTVARRLFPETPAPGAVLDKELGGGLRVRFPLSLFANTLGTLPHANATSLRALTEALAEIDLQHASPDDEDVRLADVVIAWNVFEHFYPYLDVVPVDWMAELDRALAGALADETGQQFFRTLRGLIAQLGDGHGRVVHPAYVPTGGLPAQLEWIEGKAVVTASRDSALEHGDVVLTLDGEPSSNLMAAEEELISGSPQWKRYRAMQAFGAGAPGTSVRVQVERDGRRLDVDVKRDPVRTIQEFDRPMIQKLDGGIWYVDLSRAPWSAIEPVLDSLAAAPGVVFDLRGYPAGNHMVLQHLLTGPDTSDAWMRIPHALYPDHERPVGYQPEGWQLQPAQPHIGGRIAFITDAGPSATPSPS